MKLTRNAIVASLMALSVVSCGGGGGSDSSSSSPAGGNTNQTPDSSELQTSGINPGWSALVLDSAEVLYVENDVFYASYEDYVSDYNWVIFGHNNSLSLEKEELTTKRTQVNAINAAAHNCASIQNASLTLAKCRTDAPVGASYSAIASRDNIIIHSTQDSLFVSIDNGASFNEIAQVIAKTDSVGNTTTQLNKNIVRKQQTIYDNCTQTCTSMPATPFIAGNTIVVASNTGGVSLSYDFGATWLSSGEELGIFDKVVQNPIIENELFALARTGKIYTSNDSGQSWLAVNFNFTDENTVWRGINFDAQGTLALVNDLGVIFESTNSGVSWLKLVASETLASSFTFSSSFYGSDLVKDFGYTKIGDLFFANIPNEFLYSFNEQQELKIEGSMGKKGIFLYATSDYYYMQGVAEGGFFKLER